MPQYRVTFPRAVTGPITYITHAANREQAEKAATELYRFETRGAEPGTPKTIPVYGKITEE